MTDTSIRPEGISIDAFPDVSTFRYPKRRLQRIQVNPQPGFALLTFDGTDLPPIRLKEGELSYVGGAIAGTETTLRGEDE